MNYLYTGSRRNALLYIGVYMVMTPRHCTQKPSVILQTSTDGVTSLILCDSCCESPFPMASAASSVVLVSYLSQLLTEQFNGAPLTIEMVKNELLCFGVD